MIDAAPSSVVRSRDGTPIAVFSSGDGPPLVLVHGVDRRPHHVPRRRAAVRTTVHGSTPSIGAGGAHPATPADYAIEREFEDVAAVAEARRRPSRARRSTSFGHSYGGRCALGAALLTDTIRRVVSYEGAPTPPGSSYHPAGIEARLRERLAAGDRDGALAPFLAEVVGMSAADLAAYRANPVWPVRARGAGTILRELEAEADPAASLDRLGAVRQPVLQIARRRRACRSSATRPWRSTSGWRTAASSSSTAPAMRPTTRIPTPSSRPSRRSSPSPPAGGQRPDAARDRGPTAPCQTPTMLEMNPLGWIVVGFSGRRDLRRARRRRRPPAAACRTSSIGILGGLIGGWLANAMGFTDVQGFIAAVVVAVGGSLVVRLVLDAMSGR